MRLACVRGVTWTEFEGVDWTGELVGPTLPLWRIPAERMKLTIIRKSDAVNEHLVPLPSGAATVLREARAMAYGSRYVFPWRRPTQTLSKLAIGRL